MKKTRTRIGSILLAFALVLTFLPATAMAADATVSTAEELKTALESASDGDTITLANDIVIDPTYAAGLQGVDDKEGDIAVYMTISSDITLDLQSYTISWDTSKASDASIWNTLCFAAVSEADVVMTADPSGGIDTEANYSNSYGINIINNGSVTVLDGTYTGATTAIQVEKGALTILDGTFKQAKTIEAAAPDYAKYVINCIDASFASGIARIYAMGGTYCFDPDGKPENSETTYVPDGYVSVQEGDAYTVMPLEEAAVARVEDNYYMTLPEAINGAQSGDIVTLLRNVTWDGEANDGTVLNVDGLTLDLNGYTLTAPNFSLIFQGDDFTLRNGSLVSANRGSYALFIGDERETSDIVVENVTTTGGINIYDAHNVVLRNVDVTGTNYYAVWCDENGQAVIESGIFRSNGVAVLGLAENIDGANADSAMYIRSGNFDTSNGKPLVLEDGKDRNDPVITGGYFTSAPSAYLASGYAAVDNSGDTVYQYKVVEAGESPAQVVTGEATVSVSDSITNDEEKALAQSVADALGETDQGGDKKPDIGEALNAAASTAANQNQVTTEQGVAELQKADVAGANESNVTIVVQPYLEITVDNVAVQNEIQTVTLDITPKYITVATTAKVDEGQELNFAQDTGETNAVQVGKAQKLNITKPVTVTLSLPTGFVSNGSLYVKHMKDNGRTYYYKGSVANNILTFTNPNGFSLFSFSSSGNGEVVADVNDQGYASLEAAIAAVENGGIIQLLAENLRATVSRRVSFTVTGSGADSVQFFAGNGYEMEKDGNTYTFTYVGGTDEEEDEPAAGSIISVSGTAHGSVRVNPGRAEKGDTVTITAIPDDGYELGSLTVTDRDGGSVRVSDAGNNRYTFTMPGGSVTVKAEFVQDGTAAPVIPGASFADVPEDFWAYNEINWAAENGYMNGTTTTTFDPNGTVTRQQVWMILARMAGARPADMAEAKIWAVENGISDGTNPGAAVTRQQLVALLYRFAAQNGYDTTARADLSGYPDAASVASYATDAMAWSVANGIIGGTTQGTLDPAGTANRAQFAVILWRFYQTTAI